MSRLLNKLSALRVARPSPPGLYGDGGGLWLQVSATGSKSWVFRYCNDPVKSASNCVAVCAA
ncbi:Arm DNA-binding domain-containing protein [Duganella sp. CT11-25]|jgi:hypothetical protein|uniref:Arm DNA-binding domain-containing protein n=1 Tax=unclassified Duganella TaxID=2636909 RepID=UPI0039AED2FE